MKTVVLAGGGHVNVSLLRKLPEEILNTFRFIMVSDSKRQYYSGMLPGYIEGIYSEEDFSFNLEKLCSEKNTQFTEGKITGIDALNKELITDSGKISFDFISVNIGIVTDTMKDPEGLENVAYTKPLEKIIAFADKLDKESAVIPSSSNLVIAGGGTAGCELAMAFRMRHPEMKITVIQKNKYPAPVLPQKVSEMIMSEFSDKGIELITESEVYEINENQVFTSKANIPYDFAVISSGFKGQNLHLSGVGVSPRGLIITDDTLMAAPSVFASGDCAQIKGQEWIPRAGVYAIRQADVLYPNFVSALKGENKVKRYIADPHPLQIVYTGNRKAILTKNNFTFRNHAAFILKDYIDRRYMGK